MATEPQALRLELHSTREEIGRALEELQKSCAAWGLSEAVAGELCLAADEVLANVVSHGYRGDPSGHIGLALQLSDGGLVLEIRDRAPAFDPLAVAPPELGAERDAQRIGGLGIHLLRAVVDSVEYARIEGENRLTLRRRLPAVAPDEGREEWAPD